MTFSVPGDPDATAAAVDVEPKLPNRWLRRLPGGRMAGQIGWITGSYAFAQGLRLVTNVILARLLAPQLFGVMLIVNTLRTGIELLSDIGVGQNIVSNPAGNDPAFFNTAWTLQIIRGLLLAGAVLVFAAPIAHLYDEPALRTIIPLTSLLFLLTGLQSPARFLLQKRGDVRTYSLFDIAMGIASLVVHVGLALYSPTIWALVGGLLISTLISTAASFLLIDPRVYRLRLDRAYVAQIISFGKWVFVSSLVFFLAMNFDRLYFAKVVPFALLGVYGVARTFSDTAGMLVQRVGNLLIFPRIAASRQLGTALRDAVARPRGHALLAIAAALSIAIAGSDRLILLLYDDRYRQAAFMLPILMAGVWFSILSTLGEAIMLGTGRPAHAARANAAKLIWTCAALPLALAYSGMAGALLVIAAGDLVRYASLTLSQRAQHLSFLRQDVALTLALAGLVVVWRLVFTAVGLVPTLSTWWTYGAALHG